MATIGELTGQRKCDVCKQSFVPKEPHHRRCNNCVGKAKAGDSTSQNPRPPQGNLRADFEAYLKRLNEGGYFDDEKNLREELIVRDADMVARALANGGITASQLRRFFNMSRGIEQQLENKKDFKALVPRIAKLQPFAAALIGKEQNERKRKDLEVLLDFIDVNAQKGRESEKAFRDGFLEHFESVVAYFTFYKPK